MTSTVPHTPHGTPVSFAREFPSTPATRPEQHRLHLLNKASRCYLALQNALKAISFQYHEASSLLEHVHTLRRATMELTANQRLRALDLVSDPASCSAHSLSDQSDSDIEKKFSQLSLEKKSSPPNHFPFPLCDLNETTIENAFSYLETPLKTIVAKSPKLFPNPEQVLFSMPRRTHYFFLNHLYGYSPIKIERKVEQGSCSQIESYRLGSTDFFLKALPPSSNWSWREAQIHKDELETEACFYMTSVTNHPNILRLEALSEKGLCLEPMEEDFFSFESVNNFSPQDLLYFFRQIAEALAHLHRRKIVHKDFKPENILIKQEDDNAIVKLCDFGFSAYVGTSSNFAKGTVYYASPSKLSNLHSESPDKVYIASPSDDVWGFGVFMCECVTDSLPFYNHQDIETLAAQIHKIIFPSQHRSEPHTTSKNQAAIDDIADALISSRTISPRSIRQKALSFCTQEQVKAHLNRECCLEDLFSNLSNTSLALLKTRDPHGFFQNLITRCLDGTDDNRITIEEVLTILASPPEGYS